MALTRASGKVVKTSVDTIADLPTTGYEGQTIEVLGYYTVGDGGGGTFRFSTTGTANSGTVFGSGSAYWHRQYSGAVSARWFGYLPTRTAAQNKTAMDASLAVSTTVFIPAGTYPQNEVTLIQYANIIGEGNGLTKITGSGTTPIFSRIELAISSTQWEFLLEGLDLDGNATTSAIVQLEYTNIVKIRDCYIHGANTANGVGIYLKTCFAVEISGNRLEDCHTSCIQLDKDGASVGCNHSIVTMNDINANNQSSCKAIKVSGQNIIISSNNLEGSTNGHTSIWCSATEGVLIQSNYIELWKEHGIDLSDGSNYRTSIEQNVINSLGGVSAPTIWQPVIPLDNATNTNIRISRNRFADVGSSLTCIDVGAATNVLIEENDPNVAGESDISTTAIGIGGWITATASWSPGVVGAGSGVETVVTLNDAIVGNLVLVSYDNMIAGSCTITGYVVSTNNVRVMIRNYEVAAQDFGTGTVTVAIQKVIK